MKKFVACVLALASAAAPAYAQEKCWTAKELAAARVRDLQSVLMVGALQCRATAHDVLPDFNKFVVAGRSLIITENDILKARFIKQRGMKEGNRAYDAFATALANDHSGSTARMDSFCESAQAMAVAATDAITGPEPLDALELIAERLGERPAGVGAGCPDVKPVTVVADMNPVSPMPAAIAPAQAPVVAVASAQPGR